MKISQKANCIEPSLTRDLFNRALKYDDVINLTLGDPDLPPPQNVRDAACAAIQQGKTRYSANAGLIDLRQAIAASFAKEYGLTCDAASEIITTVGGMKSLDFAIRLLESEHVAVVPGIAYGRSYDNFVRIAFTHDEKILSEACRRIKRFVGAR